jgi:hypothetical protein
VHSGTVVLTETSPVITQSLEEDAWIVSRDRMSALDVLCTSSVMSVVFKVFCFVYPVVKALCYKPEGRGFVT